jgi:hypothetical protein
MEGYICLYFNVCTSLKIPVIQKLVSYNLAVKMPLHY